VDQLSAEIHERKKKEKDRVSQLYYDANTGIYYYYDAESGRYQFHSRIEVPAVQSSAEPFQETHVPDKKWRKVQKGVKKASHQDEGVCGNAVHHHSRFFSYIRQFHAEVYFDQEQQSYMLVDQGSQNGTVINGNRILQPKTKSEPHALMHGDEVKMGETVLSFHIHSGTDTCDGCEPGQVMLTPLFLEGPGLSKEDKESLRQKELKQMKAKYGLQIELKIRKSQSGLGAGGFMSADDVSAIRSKSHKNWEKARERFADSCHPDLPTTKTQKSKAWVRSEEAEDSQTSLETGSQG
ncbi:hypothetical protein GOODEAATRI_002935, partial [Goodea atripinnis]